MTCGIARSRISRAVYGKLVYLASLRNPNQADTNSLVWPNTPNNADANRALRRSHESIFQEWVNYSLERRKPIWNYIFAL